MVLRRVPVGFDRPAWVNLQRAYYVLQATGDLQRLDGAFFNAIHEKHEQLFDEPSLAGWVGRNGGNAEKFASAYVSFSVNNQTVQADQLAEGYSGGRRADNGGGRQVHRARQTATRRSSPTPISSSPRYAPSARP